jgi:CheY-like chemotaxis protein
MDNVLVLVVEDDPFIQLDVETALQDGGYATVTAISGKAALGQLEAGADIRALVTDVNLGDAISGWDVARRARELTPDLPVVYVTSVAHDDWSAHGVPDSVLISKPFASAQLITAISQLLNEGGTH